MRRLILLLALVALPALAEIEDDEYDDLDEDTPPTQSELGRPQPNPPRLAGGSITANTEAGLWLKLQSSGRVAGSQYAIPGKIATLSYRRYLNSFRYPIPRQFSFYNRSSGSGGSGGSGLGGGGGGGGGGGMTGR